MKILLVLAGILAAAAAGAAGGALFAPAGSNAHPSVTPAEPARLAAASTALPRAAQEQIDRLNREIGDLQLQLAELRSATQRAPAVEMAAVEPQPAAVPVSAVQRDVILQVLADQKAAEARAAEEERKKREEEQRLQRADRMAQRFGLNEAEERQLADFYALERQRIDEARDRFRDAREFGAMDQEEVRNAFREARDWRSNELVRLFGPDTGKQLAEYDMERGRGGAGGFFGGEVDAAGNAGANVRRQRGGGQGGGQGGGAGNGGAGGG